MKNSWKKLNLKVDLKSVLDRQILTEKYCKYKSNNIKLVNSVITTLHNCSLFTYTDTHYPNSIFYIKKKNNIIQIIVEQDNKNNFLFVNIESFMNFYDYQLHGNSIKANILVHKTVKKLLNLHEFQVTNGISIVGSELMSLREFFLYTKV